MKNILVQVGSNKNALSHLKYAVEFAYAMKAKLHIIHVYNVNIKMSTMMQVDDLLESEGLSLINSLLKQIDTKNVEIFTRVLKGKLDKVLEDQCQKKNIDLMIMEPKSTSIKDEVFLGKNTGKVIKQTQIPTLIVPENYEYKPITRVLLAMKSAVIKKENVLAPLKLIQDNFKSIVNLLLVKTPYYNEGDFEVNEEISSMVTNTTTTENATTFQGVLEHFQHNDPDILCVVRRKRGFFMKKWEKNSILKRDFHSTRPVLVLRGLK